MSTSLMLLGRSATVLPFRASRREGAAVPAGGDVARDNVVPLRRNVVALAERTRPGVHDGGGVFHFPPPGGEAA